MAPKKNKKPAEEASTPPSSPQKATTPKKTTTSKKTTAANKPSSKKSIIPKKTVTPKASTDEQDLSATSSAKPSPKQGTLINMLDKAYKQGEITASSSKKSTTVSGKASGSSKSTKTSSKAAKMSNPPSAINPEIRQVKVVKKPIKPRQVPSRAISISSDSSESKGAAGTAMDVDEEDLVDNTSDVDVEGNDNVEGDQSDGEDSSPVEFVDEQAEESSDALDDDAASGDDQVEEGGDVEEDVEGEVGVNSADGSEEGEESVDGGDDQEGDDNSSGQEGAEEDTSPRKRQRTRKRTVRGTYLDEMMEKGEVDSEEDLPLSPVPRRTTRTSQTTKEHKADKQLLTVAKRTVQPKTPDVKGKGKAFSKPSTAASPSKTSASASAKTPAPSTPKRTPASSLKKHRGQTPLPVTSLGSPMNITPVPKKDVTESPESPKTPTKRKRTVDPDALPSVPAPLPAKDEDMQMLSEIFNEERQVRDDWFNVDDGVIPAPPDIIGLSEGKLAHPVTDGLTMSAALDVLKELMDPEDYKCLLRGIKFPSCGVYCNFYTVEPHLLRGASGATKYMSWHSPPEITTGVILGVIETAHLLKGYMPERSNSQYQSKMVKAITLLPLDITYQRSIDIWCHVCQNNWIPGAVTATGALTLKTKPHEGGPTSRE